MPARPSGVRAAAMNKTEACGPSPAVRRPICKLRGPDRLEEEKVMELIVTSIAGTFVLLLGHFCIVVWNRLTGSR